METRHMISFLYLLFPLFVTFISEFENSQNSFSFGPPFDPFWSVKCINVGQKLPIRTAEHTFVESRHPEDTKNSYYALSLERSQNKKRYQLMDYYCDTYLYNQINFILHSFLRYCKDFSNLLFWVGQTWPCPLRLMASTCRIASCLFICK